jgi:hypothetical protein
VQFIIINGQSTLSSGTLYRVALVQTILENVSCPSSVVIQLCKPINLRTPEDGENTFSEMLVPTSAAQYIVAEDTFKWHCN